MPATAADQANSLRSGNRGVSDDFIANNFMGYPGNTGPLPPGFGNGSTNIGQAPTNIGSIGGTPQPAASPWANPAPTTIDPKPSTTTTPVDPMQANANKMATDYAGGLADGSNAEITRALGRQRDEISVGMQKEGEAAMGRGAGAGLFRTRALESGQRSMNDLHGRLTDVALGRRNEAINTVSGTANAAANTRNTLHLGTMAQALNERRVNLEQADQQSRLQQAPYDRLMSMMGMVGQYGSSLMPTTSAPNPGLFGTGVGGSPFGMNQVR